MCYSLSTEIFRNVRMLCKYTNLVNHSIAVLKTICSLNVLTKFCITYCSYCYYCCCPNSTVCFVYLLKLNTMMFICISKNVFVISLSVLASGARRNENFAIFLKRFRLGNPSSKYRVNTVGWPTRFELYFPPLCCY